jgi:sugar lactone lactonase YvrE
MSSRAVICLQAANATLGEGPVWDASRSALWWVDIKQQKLHCFQADSTDASGQPIGQWQLPCQVGCLGLWQDDRLILALADGIYGFDTATLSLTRHGALAPEPGAIRFNDGKIDPAGRFWVGSLDDRSFPASGALYSVATDGSSRRHLGDIRCANGIGWTADGATMYFTDSMRRVIWQFDFDAATGAISNQRDFAHIAEPAVPDGLAVDEDGCVWSALWDGAAIVRFDPQGQEIERIALPVKRPTSCAFGGQDRRTLFVTSASIDLSAQDLIDGPLAGGLFAIRTDTRGVEVGRFLANSVAEPGASSLAAGPAPVQFAAIKPEDSGRVS